MGLAHPIRDVMDQSRLKQHRYTGYVAEDNDPKKVYRVKIRIPQLHRNIPLDELPWALPHNRGKANMAGGVGATNIPRKGAKVFVYFEHDDPHNVYYTHSPSTEDVVKNNYHRNHQNYPNVSGFVDEINNRLSIDTKAKTVEFVHTSGAKIHIAADGSITLASAPNADLTLSSKRNIKMVAGGNASISAGDAMSITSTNTMRVQSKNQDIDIAAKRDTHVSAKRDLKTTSGRDSLATSLGPGVPNFNGNQPIEPGNPDAPVETQKQPDLNTTYDDETYMGS